MVYVALLRGINVGGHSAVNMKELKAVFDESGMSRSRTYINSGNVVFESDMADAVALAETLEAAIEDHFGFPVSVLVRGREEIREIVAALPGDWVNDEATKCDVFFLWPEVDRSAVLYGIDYDPAVDELRYVPGAILRRVDRKNAPKSRLPRLAGTPLYQQMTIRNCNTPRRLLALMDEYGHDD